MTTVRRVGDLAEQVRGVTYSKDDASDEPRPGYVPVLRAGNIQESRILFDDLVYVPRQRVSREQLLKKFDVLIATSSGSLDVVGKAAQVTADVDAGFGAFCKVLRPLNGVNPRYFAHWFSTPAYRHRVSSLAAGANINNLRNEHLDDLEMPFPPLGEQGRIADILDKADAIRRKRKQAIALTDDLLRSTFLDMFGDPVANPKNWPVASLGEVAIFYAGNSLPEGEPFVGQSSGFLLLKVGDMNIAENETGIRVAREWTQLGAGGIQAPVGAVVLPKRGGAIATNKKRVLERQVLLDPNLMAVAPRANVEGRYLQAWLEFLDLRTISNGSAVPQLNKKDLTPLQIPLPPKSLQRDFCASIATLRHGRLHLAQAATLAETLFGTLISQVFGTVRVP